VINKRGYIRRLELPTTKHGEQTLKTLCAARNYKEAALHLVTGEMKKKKGLIVL